MNYNFPEDMKSIREILGLSQSEFAEQIGVEQVTVSRNELGKTEPSAGLLEAVYAYAFAKNVKINRLKEMLWRDDLLQSEKLLFHGAKSEITGNIDIHRGRQNNITVTDPWMIPYFPGETYDEKFENAKQYTAYSSKKINFQCIDCKQYIKTPKSISNLYKNHSIGCKCSDKKSYPNKFSYAFLEQLPIYDWQYEYQPEWANPYFYDNYFKYKNKEYILEMDGELGHGKRKYKGNINEKDIKSMERDKIKDQLSKEHNITMIRIDATESNKEYLSNQLKNNNVIQDIFKDNLSNIDWNYCDEFATKNIIKAVCEYWESNDHPEYKIVMKKFHIKWFGTIQEYFKKGTNFGWCNYNKDKYRKERQTKSLGKTISVYLVDGIYLKTYLSYSDFKKNFENDFGTKVCYAKVKDVVNGILEEYKGFIFKENESNHSPYF